VEDYFGRGQGQSRTVMPEEEVLNLETDQVLRDIGFP
jgi:hypothetical protein